MTLSRESIQRMITDMVGGGGGGAGISGSALANLLTGYATQDWVGENYISIEFFSRLFKAHGTENGQQTDIDPNDMDSTITSIEALFGFWTDLYISALGNGGSIGSSIYLSTLADVQLSSPATGQVLTYNATTGKWVNANPQGGVTDLASLTDVTLTSLASGQTLLYDSTTSKWYNSALKTINGQSLLGSGDISVGGGASGNYLPLTGGTLVGKLYFSMTHTTAEKEIVLSSGNGIDQYGNIQSVFNSGTWGIIRNGSNILSLDYSNSFLTVTNLVLGQLQLNTAPTAFACWVGNNSANGFAYTSPSNMPFVLKAGDTMSGRLTMQCATYDGESFGVGCIEVSPTNTTSWQRAIRCLNASMPATSNLLYAIGQGDNAYNMAMFYFHYEGNGSSYNRASIGLHTTGDVINCLASGNVGIGTTSPSYKLHVDGTIYATGAVTALSDARKKDVQGGAKIGVEQIAHAPAVQFLWKGERAKEGLQVGTLAQYWQAVLPEVVMDKGGELSMQYGVAALVSAIITARKVVDHERRIQELEKENQDLRREISNIRVKTNIHMHGGIG